MKIQGIAACLRQAGRETRGGTLIMKRNIILLALVSALVLSILPGCGNIGEDPLPFPGWNEDRSAVTLFVNGAFYSFDYTAEYDGIEVVGYIPAKPDGSGGLYTSMASKEWGSAVEGGIKSMEFRHDTTSVEEAWKITMMDDTIVPAGTLTFSAMTFGGELGDAAVSKVKFSVWTSRNRVTDYEVIIPLSDRDDGEWHQYTVSVAGAGLEAGETLKQWQVGVPALAGKIYVDNIILSQPTN